MSAVGDANGAARPAEWQGRDTRPLADYGYQIQHDAQALTASVRDATQGVQRYLSAQAEERPITILGVAAALGYLLGGGLGSRLTFVLLGAATRVGTALVARELGSRILPSGSPAIHNSALEDNSESQRSNHDN